MEVNGITENCKGQGHWRRHPSGVKSKKDEGGTRGGEAASGLPAVLAGRMTTAHQLTCQGAAECIGGYIPPPGEEDEAGRNHL